MGCRNRSHGVPQACLRGIARCAQADVYIKPACDGTGTGKCRNFNY